MKKVIVSAVFTALITVFTQPLAEMVYNRVKINSKARSHKVVRAMGSASSSVLEKLSGFVFGAVHIRAKSIVTKAKIDMDAVKMIESSGNPGAYNERSGAIGLYQITYICLEEWNNYHPREPYDTEDLWDAGINTKIATWYLQERIPSMLRHYKQPLSYQNILISYNAGISYVVKGKKLPQETVNYIKKYERLTDGLAKK